MVLADDLITELLASWNTGVIAKPSLTAWHDRADDKVLAKGWVKSTDESLESDILGSGAFGQRVTPFEIMIPCDTEANYAKYKSEVERIIFAKSVTSGWWEINNYPTEDFDWTHKRFNFHAVGQQIKWS